MKDEYKSVGKGNLAFNMVYTPPYSQEKLAAIKTYIEELKLPPDLNSNQAKDMLQWAMEEYLDNPAEQKLARLIQRPVFNEPIEDYFLNGCCARLCDLCYVTAYNDQGEFDIQKKRKNCRRQLQSIERSLAYLITLMKKHPDKLDRLYKYEIT